MAAQAVDVLVIGAGITGLGIANFVQAEAARRNQPTTCMVLEAEAEPGGYCRTVEQDGFVWDYAGHFFHFARPEIEAWLRARMPNEAIATVTKRSYIRYAGRNLDFPFQKNIHQLPQAEFIECLHDLYFRNPTPHDASFRAMLYAKYGQGIADKFLVPYNQKLYACALDTLDANAMGRFFPHAELGEIIANMRVANNASYNATFTYPARGAMAYVRALLHDLPTETVRLHHRVTAIDAAAQVVTTTQGQFRYRTLVSTAPLPRLLHLLGRSDQAQPFAGNKVVVWNLGFDRKGPRDIHWLYVPDPARCFYRVGFYDNMFAHSERMSLYVELGFPSEAVVDPQALRARVLDDLRAEGIVTDQQLVSSHTVTLDPAYAHITVASLTKQAELAEALAQQQIYSIGRYGRWTYCSMEDNLLEARALAPQLLAQP